mmetsp:Transcript_13939/g.35075  ORF Transcript_13939/g.35075 Transcript_13939/m.35075 type:complete len:142 (+) Transcript_13939:1003-1428(+)
MVHHASRIESNCFGLYANPAPPRPPPSPDAAETETETNAGGHGAGSGEESGEKSPPPPQQQQRPPKNAVIGRVVYLEASMFNHSCDPCCEISREATEACEVRQQSNTFPNHFRLSADPSCKPARSTAFLALRALVRFWPHN